MAAMSNTLFSQLRLPPRAHHHHSLLFPSVVPLLRRLANQNPYPKSLLTHPCLIQVANTGAAATATTCAVVSNGLHLKFPELCIDDEQHEALLQTHPALRSATVESLRQRLVSLQSVGIEGLALHSTVLRRPEILTAKEIGPVLDFVSEELEELDLFKLEKLLVSADLKTLSCFPDRVRLLLDHGVPRDKIGRFINNVNMKKVFCDKTAEEIEQTILYLKSYDGLTWLLRRPQLLNLDLDHQIIPRVDYLLQLSGGDTEATKALIGKLPFILAYSVEHYRGHVEFWRSVGLGEDELFKIALVYPNIISVSKERKLAPRIEFLRQCGLSGGDLFRFLVKAPLFLSLSFEANLSKKLGLLVKIGYRHRTRELAAAMGAATRTSVENMQMVVGTLLGYGFSCEDLLAMSRKQPQILQYNHESLGKKVQYLVEEMDREIGELLAFPAFLGYKLDDRIKRRYEAKKGSRGKRLSINKLLSVSTEKFVSE